MRSQRPLASDRGPRRGARRASHQPKPGSFGGPPTWVELATETVHHPNVEDGEPNQPRVGWQAPAAREVESSFLANLRMTLSNAEGALLRSKGGPQASARLSVSRRIAPHVWNRNSSGSCSCANCVSHSLFQPVPADVAVLFDVLGHHRAACANVGVLGRRGFALESAAARVGCEFASPLRLPISFVVFSSGKVQDVPVGDGGAQFCRAPQPGLLHSPSLTGLFCFSGWSHAVHA